MVFISVESAVTGTFLTDEEVNKALHEHAAELGAEEVQRLADRTPVLTGALQSAARARSYEDPAAANLVTIYYSDSPQITQWNRVYVAYQEGPPLGLSTYTNGPRQMVNRADPEDVPAIEAWAQRAVASAEAESPLLEGITLDEFIAQMGTL